MGDLMCHYHCYTLFVSGGRLGGVKEDVRLAERDETPIFHGTGHKVRNWYKIWQEENIILQIEFSVLCLKFVGLQEWTMNCRHCLRIHSRRKVKDHVTSWLWKTCRHVFIMLRYFSCCCCFVLIFVCLFFVCFIEWRQIELHNKRSCTTYSVL